MANNITVKDSSNADTVLKTTDNTGVHTPHHNVDSIAAGDNNIGNVDIASIAAGDNNIGNVDVASLPASTNTIEVVGDAAENAAAAGNPLLAGGRYDATPRTLGDGDVGALALDADGAVQVSDGGNTLTVDGTVAVSGTVTVDGSGVTQPVSHAALTELAAAIDTEVQVDVVGALPAGTNAIGKLAANSGVDIGDVDVTSISAGSNLIGDVGLQGRTTGGLTIFRSIDIDESEEEVKASAGTLYTIAAFNRTAGPLYLKFYNLTAANTTVGTSTPVLTFVVPGNADSDGAGFILTNPLGFAFDTAITVACTGAVADNDTTAPGANECVINLGYK